MVNKLSKADKKIAYDAKLCQLLDEYSQILIAAADNVGSTQLQNIRRGLRGDSVVLMGKNTMMKRSVRIHSEKTGNKTFLNLIPLLQVYNNIDYLVPFISFFIVLKLVIFVLTNA
jgi:large subunit ribosomal protein LP0